MDLSVQVGASGPKERRRPHFLIIEGGNLGQAVSCWIPETLGSLRCGVPVFPLWSAPRTGLVERVWRTAQTDWQRGSASVFRGCEELLTSGGRVWTSSFWLGTWRMPRVLVMTVYGALKFWEMSSQMEHLQSDHDCPGWMGIVLIHTLLGEREQQNWWSKAEMRQLSPGERLNAGGSDIVGTEGPG